MPEEKKVEKRTVASAPAPAPAPAPKATVGGGDKDSNLMAALGYIINLVFLPWSFAIYFVKKEDKFVRFHALQAGILWLVALVIGIVFTIINLAVFFVLPFKDVLSCIVGLLGLVISIAFLAVDLYAAYMAYQGTKWEMPVIGALAKSHAE